MAEEQGADRSRVPATASAEELVRRLEALSRDNEAALARLGRVDHVTLLPNRLQFLEDFAATAAAAKQPYLVLVALADARHFNELLRALGHAYAEEFVQEGARRLAGILPDGVRIYHVSVLSFALVADDPSGAEPPSVVPSIVGVFREPIRCRDIPINSKVGVGVTRLKADGAPPAELLRSALAAAQDSRRGFSGWAWYDRGSDEAHRRAFRLLADLPRALAGVGELSLNYQPRVSLKSGGCVGAEALVRWSHPDLGSVPPSEFVALAESTALITPLTQWVMRQAVSAAGAWQRQWPDLRVSINVSPKNLEEPEFVDMVVWECEAAGVDSRLIELEFTEGALAANPALAFEQLRQLQGKGFDIAIDDFGSGYSNMSNLGVLPARCLKIDQAFVRPLEQDRRKQLLVRSIIEMAHALDYHVVAEGIETQGAYNMLSGWGCDEGQGYFMSRPLTEGHFLAWMAAGAAN